MYALYSAKLAKKTDISQGASVTSDSLKLSPCLSVIISCSEALSPEDANRLNEWLKIRMETEDIILVQKQ